MKELIDTLLASAQTYGAGYILAAVGFLLYYREHLEHRKEREDHVRTLERVISLSTASISADKDNTAALMTLTRVLDSVDRRLASTVMVLPPERRLQG